MVSIIKYFQNLRARYISKHLRVKISLFKAFMNRETADRRILWMFYPVVSNTGFS